MIGKRRRWLAGTKAGTHSHPGKFGNLRIGQSVKQADIKTTPKEMRQMSAAGRLEMHAILFIIVLLLAAPLILYASPVIMYVLPFIRVGLGLSLFADHVRHQARTEKH